MLKLSSCVLGYLSYLLNQVDSLVCFLAYTTGSLDLFYPSLVLVPGLVMEMG
uniref:Uncharacterized protein n=1 Tax=Arundo donax TaxID=35708 RepID=A0A0A8YR28_ARUDO